VGNGGGAEILAGFTSVRLCELIRSSQQLHDPALRAEIESKTAEISALNEKLTRLEMAIHQITKAKE
jgi:hypothetical protein